MKKETRKCAVCGKKFTPKSANAAYCSEKCYKVAKAKKDKARKAIVKANKNKGVETLKKLKTPIADGKHITKKVVKAVCKEKIVLSKKPSKEVRVEVRKLSPEMTMAVSFISFMKCLREFVK